MCTLTVHDTATAWSGGVHKLYGSVQRWNYSEWTLVCTVVYIICTMPRHCATNERTNEERRPRFCEVLVDVDRYNFTFMHYGSDIS